MSTGYLVDTDWAIHYLNGHPEIVEKLQLLKKDGAFGRFRRICDKPQFVLFRHRQDKGQSELCVWSRNRGSFSNACSTIERCT